MEEYGFKQNGKNMIVPEQQVLKSTIDEKQGTK